MKCSVPECPGEIDLLHDVQVGNIIAYPCDNSECGRLHTERGKPLKGGACFRGGEVIHNNPSNSKGAVV